MLKTLHLRIIYVNKKILFYSYNLFSLCISRFLYFPYRVPFSVLDKNQKEKYIFFKNVFSVSLPMLILFILIKIKHSTIHIIHFITFYLSIRFLSSTYLPILSSSHLHTACFIKPCRNPVYKCTGLRF